MAPIVYKSTDANAPAKLTGVAGSLITVLDACLVNGYTGKTAAGWTKPFNSANQAVYRMATAGSTGFYLHVNDNGPGGTTLGREAFCRGYEVASGVGAGTGPFPTVAQIANGIAVRKKATPDATATDSPWVVVADDKTFYLFINTQDFTGWTGFSFGDIYSLKTGDLYRCHIIGRAVNNAVVALDSDDRLDDLAAMGAAATGHYMPRTWQGSDVAAVNVGKHGDAAHSSTVLVGLAHYPNPHTQTMLLAPVKLHEDLGSLSSIRGRMRGFWHFLHPVGSAVNDTDTPAGGGDLTGKNFVVIKPTAEGNGVYVIETSAWDTSS